MKIHDLQPAPGSNKSRKRVGRGVGGKGGKTAGRGSKGTRARNTVRAGFEGGQMPMLIAHAEAEGFQQPVPCRVPGDQSRRDRGIRPDRRRPRPCTPRVWSARVLGEDPWARDHRSAVKVRRMRSRCRPEPRSKRPEARSSSCRRHSAYRPPSRATPTRTADRTEGSPARRRDVTRRRTSQLPERFGPRSSEQISFTLAMVAMYRSARTSQHQASTSTL